MSGKVFNAKGFKITIIKKTSFDAVGFSRPVNFEDGSIGLFLDELAENGQMKKLAETLRTPQQIWVCLSGANCGDYGKCLVCDSSCKGFDVRCTVCVEKTENHDFSQFNENELFTLRIPASEWADFEMGEGQSFTELHKNDVYKLVGEIGYEWNEKIGLHFDNEHEESIPNKKLCFLLPVKIKE